MLINYIEKRSQSKFTVGVISSYANTAIGIICNFIVIPVYLKYLGREEYGLWITVSGVVTYLGLINFGITQTTSNYFGKAVANQVKSEQNKILTTGFWLYIKVVSIAVMVAVCIAPIIPWHLLIKGSIEIKETVKYVFIAAAVTFLIELPFTLFGACLRTVGKIYVQQSIAAIQNIARLAAAFIFLFMGGKLVGLIFLLSFINLLSYFANYLLLKKELPYLSILLSNYDSRMRSEMKKPSLYYLLLQISGAILFSTDALVISAIIGAEAVAPYSVAQRIAYIGMIVVTTTSVNFGPSFLNAYAKRDQVNLRALFKKSMMISIGIGSVVGAGLLIFGPLLIPLWVGDNNYVGFFPFSMIILLVFIQMLLNPSDILLNITGNHGRYAVFCLWEAVLNLALSLLLVRKFGVGGVAMGTVIARLFGAGPVMLLESYKVLKITRISSVAASNVN